MSASIRPLRRSLSILLLAVFGLLFVSPLFALSAQTEANLAACCRRNGKHHCMEGMGERTQLSDHDAQFQAPLDKCPYCPATVAGMHGDTFAPPTALSVFSELIAHPAADAQTESKLRISRTRSRQKRGPPASLAL